MFHYNLNDPTIFLNSSAHVRKLASGYKMYFSFFHVHGLVIFRIHVHIQNLERSPGGCMQT